MSVPTFSRSELREDLKIAKAGIEFGSMMYNPATYISMLNSVRKGEGLTLPGQRYIGPGNDTTDVDTTFSDPKYHPKGLADQYAYFHDLEYEAYINEGLKPRDIYMGFSPADQRLIDRLQPHDKEQVAGLLGMYFKKGLSKVGIGKRLSDPEGHVQEDVKRYEDLLTYT